MNDLLVPVSKSNGDFVPSNSFPNVYPCSDIGKDSSALSLSFLDLTNFPQHVVCKFEFLSNLVVFTISDWIPSYMLRYSSFNISSVGPKSTSILSFSSLISEWALQMLTVLMSKL